MPSSGFVSTGHLPAAPDVGAAVQEAFARFSDARDGEPSTVYPALERVDPDAFGVSLIDVHGTAWEAGDVTTPFTIMSVAKPFVFALAARALGADRLDELVGVDATGLPFNSLEAVEAGPDGRTNPMVNAGAIATTALVPGATTDERWAAIRDGLSAFAGRPLTVDDEVYASASATNDRNRAIAWLLNSRGRLAGEPDDALDLYTRLTGTTWPPSVPPSATGTLRSRPSWRRRRTSCSTTPTISPYHWHPSPSDTSRCSATPPTQ